MSLGQGRNRSRFRVVMGTQVAAAAFKSSRARPSKASVGRGVTVSAALLACLGICTPFALRADTPLLKRYDHEVWRSRDGLPSDNVQAIARTPDGYLWLGTSAGLVRFDGSSFARLEDLTTQPAPLCDVRVLLAARGGALWIGTRDGALHKWNGTSLATLGRAGEFGKEVQSLYEDSGGTLWVGTRGRGLVRIRGNTHTGFSTREGLPSNSVFAVRPAADGALWLGTGAGLMLWKDGPRALYTTRNGLPSDHVFYLAPESGGGLWVGTLGGGLVRWRDGTFTRAVAGDDRPPMIFSVAEDAGAVWIGTQASGLLRLDGDGSTVAIRADLLGSNTVYMVLPDPEGNLWVGTQGGGLHCLRRRMFLAYGPEDGLPEAPATCVLQDRHGDLWVGTRGGGLARRHDGRWTTLTATGGGLPSDWVTALAEDRQDGLWIGTAGGGLARLRRAGLQTIFRDDGSRLERAVMAIEQDQSGTLWYSSGSALYRYDHGVRRSLLPDADPPGSRIRAIRSAADGSVWIGGQRGLFRWIAGRLEPIEPEDPSAAVYSVLEDSHGVVWVGGKNGLERVRDGRRVAVAGTPRAPLHQILEDASADLWLFMKGRLLRLRRDQIDALASGAATDAWPISVPADPDAVLVGGGTQPGAWRDSSGRLWFATRSGLLSLDPATLAAPVGAPRIAIERMTADRRPIDLKDPRFPAGTRLLEIRFAAPSLSAPGRVQLRYRLDGIDRDWIDAGRRRVAEYVDVPPGAYRFRVQSRQDGGEWVAPGALTELRIAPHFYQTLWFLLLSAFGLDRHGVGPRIDSACASCGSASRRCSKNARAWRATSTTRWPRDSRRSRCIWNRWRRRSPPRRPRPDTTSTAPSTPSATASRRPGVRSGISGAARRATPTSRPGLAELAEEVSAGTGLNVDVHARGNVRELPAHVEEELLRVGQEALSNAVRHAEARAIRVRVTYGRAGVRLDVRDDGRGFDSGARERIEGHFGLVGMRERAARLGGRLSLRSRPGRGTRVGIVVPLAPPPEAMRKRGGSHGVIADSRPIG